MIDQKRVTKLKKEGCFNYKLIGHFSIKDPIGKTYSFDKNEDALIAKCPLLGIADGAGGVGVFCGEWAQHLLGTLPIDGFENIEQVNNWFDSVSEDFYNKTSLIIKSSRPSVEERFTDEGSYSTLSAIWLKDSSFKYLSVGDSGIFGFKKNEKGCYNLVFLKPFGFQNSINDNPHLVNWSLPLDKKVIFWGEIEKSDVDLIIIASDSLSRFIISCVISIDPQLVENLAEGDLNSGFIESVKQFACQSYDFETVTQLLDNLRLLVTKAPDDREQTLRTMISNGLLQSDDLSLIFLEK
jgi:hypothetical protein